MVAEITAVRLNAPMAAADFVYSPPGGSLPMTQPDYTSSLLAVGRPAPDFHLATPTGGRLQLSRAARGKNALLVSFWSYSSRACREVFPRLEKLYAQLRTKGLELIAINVGDSAAVINRYVIKNRFSFPIGVANGAGGRAGVLEAYGVRALPTNYVLDAGGRIVWRAVGFDEAKIRAALAGLGVR